MTLKSKARSKFVRQFGKQFKDDTTTRLMYSRDMSDLPQPVKIMISNFPDAVILPNNKEEIREIFKLANQTSVPITPRGGASAGFGGGMSYKKGIVVDCKGIETETFIDPFEQSVIVSPSVVFSDLQRLLQLQGFSLCSYPSSIYSATVGGWISHGGFGVGSVKYGGALDQIMELEVVLPNGEPVTYKERDDIALFVGSNGTLGIITRVKLRIKFDIPLVFRGCTYDSPKELMEGLAAFSEIDPFSIWFFNPKHVEEINETFGFNLPNRYIVIVTKEVSFEEEEETFHSNFSKAIRNSGGQILDKRYITNIWEIRFRTFSILKNYEDYIISEVILPYDNSSRYIQNLVNKFKNEVHFEGEVIGDGNYSLILLLPVREKINEIKKAILNLKLFKLVLKGIKMGGYPYSTGLWFAGYYEHIYGKEQYQKYKEFKKKIDPKNISNPGKVISPKLKLFPLIPLKTAIKLANVVIL